MHWTFRDANSSSWPHWTKLEYISIVAENHYQITCPICKQCRRILIVNVSGECDLVEPCIWRGPPTSGFPTKDLINTFYPHRIKLSKPVSSFSMYLWWHLTIRVNLIQYKSWYIAHNKTRPEKTFGYLYMIIFLYTAFLFVNSRRASMVQWSYRPLWINLQDWYIKQWRNQACWSALCLVTCYDISRFGDDLGQALVHTRSVLEGLNQSCPSQAG